MSISAIVKISGTDPQKEASIHLFVNQSIDFLIRWVLDDIKDYEWIDEDSERINYDNIYKKWRDDGITPLKLTDDEELKHMKCPGEDLDQLIAIEHISSYYFNYFYIPNFKFVDDYCEIKIHEH